jgi:hypothetical protein
MTRLSNYLLHEIAEAQSRSMERLLEGWDKEIEAAAKALEDARKKQLALEAQGAAQAVWIAQIVQGLISQASSGDDVTCSIPGNVGVEGLIGAGTSVDELNAVISEVDSADDRTLAAQKNAVVALKSGVVPAAVDIADIFGTLKVDLSARSGDRRAIDALAEWEGRFRDIESQVQRLARPAQGDPQLQIWLGAQRLELARENVKLLEAHRPDRTLRLVANPKSLLDDPSRISAPPEIERGTAPKMGRDNFNAMLDRLPWVA